MYAIVEIAGKQYKVREQEKLYVPRLPHDVDDTVTFDRVLLLAGDDVQIGAPTIGSASVSATVVDHVRGDKVIVFKKKRRKRFKVKRGHRQDYTQIQIQSIGTNGSKQKRSKKEEAPAREAPAEEAAGA